MPQQHADVVDVPEEGHYALFVQGAQVGLAAYRITGSTITFTHTETDPQLQGHGLAGRLVQGALDDVRRRGLAVVPRCSYVREWIGDHPAYADLVRPPAAD